MTHFLYTKKGTATREEDQQGFTLSLKGITDDSTIDLGSIKTNQPIFFILEKKEITPEELAPQEQTLPTPPPLEFAYLSGGSQPYIGSAQPESRGGSLSVIRRETVSNHMNKIQRGEEGRRIEISNNASLDTVCQDLDIGMVPVGISTNEDGKICLVCFPLFDRDQKQVESFKFGLRAYTANIQEKPFDTFEWAQTKDLFSALREFIDCNSDRVSSIINPAGNGLSWSSQKEHSGSSKSQNYR